MLNELFTGWFVHKIALYRLLHGVELGRSVSLLFSFFLFHYDFLPGFVLVVLKTLLEIDIARLPFGDHFSTLLLLTLL